MIKEQEKNLVMQAIRITTEHLIEEQEREYAKISSIPSFPEKFNFPNDLDTVAAEFYSTVANLTIEHHTWLPEELEKIPDVRLKGLLGFYNATANQLQLMKAAKAFYLATHQCN